MRKFFILLSVCCLCLGACKEKKVTLQTSVSAQNQSLNQPSDFLLKGELSPDQILGFVRDHPESGLHELWTHLKIEELDSEKRLSYRYRAEKFIFALPKKQELVMLRVSQNISDMPIRHLFFRKKNQGDQWEFFSYEDEENLKYGVAVDPYVETIGDKYWVVISSRGWFGTGIGIIWKTWYNLDQKEAKGVLQESEKHQFIGSSNAFVKSESKVGSRTLVNDIPFVILNYSFGWEVQNPDDSIELFSKLGSLKYTWNPRRNKFIYDKVTSSIAENYENKYELKKDVGFTVDLTSYFIELMKVAKQGSRKQKDELASILDSKERLHEIRGKKEMRCLKELRIALHSQ